MKGRPKSIRKINFIPSVSGFKPYGDNLKVDARNAIFLLWEEYEALRLNDYENHTQAETAQMMGISRPTLTRIYMHARQKIAQAFIEGRQIIIEGGKVQLDGDWYVCPRCKAIFTLDSNEPNVCALCGYEQIESYTLCQTEQEAKNETPSDTQHTK